MATTTALLVGLCLARTSAAETAAPANVVLDVTGALPRTGTLSLAALQAIGTTRTTWSSRGSSHQVEGVALDKVLEHFGFAAGAIGPGTAAPDKLAGWRRVVIASAPDGFQAVLSCAELSPAIGPTRALLIWKMDGQPLSAQDGPVRLVVPTDSAPGRAVRNLRTIQVIDVAGGSVH